MLSTTGTRWAGLAAIVGGPLWIVYSVCLMLEPWGPAEVYREELGYQLVTNWQLYWAYALPGSLAVVLTAWALLGLSWHHCHPTSRIWQLGALLAYLSLGLGVVSFIGTMTLMAPLSFAGRAFGSLALGAATVVVGVDLPRGHAVSSVAVVLLGIFGLVLLPLLPLVWAWQLIPASIATGIMALFGLGWLVLGYRLSRASTDGISRPA